MSKTKSFILNGVAYPSMTEVANAYDLSIQKLSRRLKSGWSLSQAVELEPPPPREKNPASKSVSTKDGDFPSMKAAATYYGVNVANVRARLKLGWSIEEALEICLRQEVTKPKDSWKEIQCENQLFRSIGKFAEYYNLKYRLVYKRLRLGWTPEQAVGLADPPPKYRNPDGTEREHSWVKPTVTARGLKFAESAAGIYTLYAIENSINDKIYIGITTSSVTNRFYLHKKAAAKAESTSKLYNAMRKLGIENFSIRIVRQDAKSVEELLRQETDFIQEMDTIKNGYNTSLGGTIGTGNEIFVDGKVFYSQAQAAEFYGIDPSVFNLRLSRLGWSPEEAAGLKKRSKAYRNTATVNLLNGETLSFPSVYAAAAHFGVNNSTVQLRLKNGWSMEEALEVTPPSKSKRKRPSISYQNETFTSYPKLAERLNVPVNSLRNYLMNSNLSIEEIVCINENGLQRAMQRRMVSTREDHKTALSAIRKQLRI